MSSKMSLKERKSMRSNFRVEEVEEEEAPLKPTFSLQLQQLPLPKPLWQPPQDSQHSQPPPKLAPGSSDRIPEAQRVIPVQNSGQIRQIPPPEAPVPMRIIAEKMRDLRDVIHYRYTLDIDTWS